MSSQPRKWTVGLQEGEFHSIQEAIAMASAEDEVQLLPGRYDGHLDIDKPLNLSAAEPGTAEIVGHVLVRVPWNKDPSQIHIRGLTAQGIHILGHLIALIEENKINNDMLASISIPASPNMRVHLYGMYGFSAAGLAQLTLCRNRISGSLQGVYLDNTTFIIEGNEICSNTRGVSISRLAAESVLRGNHIHHNKGAGVHIMVQGGQLQLRENVIEQNGGYGLEMSVKPPVHSMSYLEVQGTGNRFMGNKRGACHGPWSRELRGQRAAVSEVMLRVPHDFKTIQEALDAAPPGAEILLDPGEYREHILIDKPIALQGMGETTILSASGTVIYVAKGVRGVQISHLCICRADFGAELWGETSLRDVTIRDNQLGLIIGAREPVLLDRVSIIGNGLRAPRPSSTELMLNLLRMLPNRATEWRQQYLNAADTALLTTEDDEAGGIFGVGASMSLSLHHCNVRSNKESGIALSLGAAGRVEILDSSIAENEIGLDLRPGYGGPVVRLVGNTVVGNRKFGIQQQSLTRIEGQDNHFEQNGLDVMGEMPREVRASSEEASRTEIHVPKDLAKLQSALDAAAKGATITLAPGDYRGGCVIDRSVSIRAEQAGMVRILGQSEAPVFFIQHDVRDVRLEGVELAGGQTGLFIKGQVRLAHVTIRDCLRPLHIVRKGEVTLENCDIHRATRDGERPMRKGIYVEGRLAGFSSRINEDISDNECLGISLEGCSLRGILSAGMSATVVLRDCRLAGRLSLGGHEGGPDFFAEECVFQGVDTYAIQWTGHEVWGAMTLVNCEIRGRQHGLGLLMDNVDCRPDITLRNCRFVDLPGDAVRIGEFDSDLRYGMDYSKDINGGSGDVVLDSNSFEGIRGMLIRVRSDFEGQLFGGGNTISNSAFKVEVRVPPWLFLPRVSASVIRVPQDMSSLQEALDRAPDGAVIEIAQDFKDANQLGHRYYLIVRPVTLRSREEERASVDKQLIIRESRDVVVENLCLTVGVEVRGGQNIIIQNNHIYPSPDYSRAAVSIHRTKEAFVRNNRLEGKLIDDQGG